MILERIIEVLGKLVGLQGEARRGISARQRYDLELFAAAHPGVQIARSRYNKPGTELPSGMIIIYEGKAIGMAYSNEIKLSEGGEANSNIQEVIRGLRVLYKENRKYWES